MMWLEMGCAAVHLRISACLCAQRSWGRFMTSLAACHKIRRRVSSPETDYSGACPLSNLFLPFLRFLLLIPSPVNLWGFYHSAWSLRLLGNSGKIGVYGEVKLFPNVSLAQITGHVWPSLNAPLAPGQIFALLIALSVHIFGLFEHLCEIIFPWKCRAPL